ncbi:hypothetical protein OKJ48_39400 [Streptomyces kunmingensis]|uniref:Uncharacterized protein n=1 Tax=Streptomyces kunmingensis TaxID=68225 RepID=A0ABU6CND9_9ACTN|nr:hypothetical protein [Streptomyces kunmingensis]MEB3966250.1 hypothetical protein [Streptomyces kunmingensis]
MGTAPRFRRTPAVQQYGTADIRHMTPEEIAAAHTAGNLVDLQEGRDPDATVDHKPYCKGPDVGLDDEGLRSVRAGDPVAYICANCHARKEI